MPRRSASVCVLSILRTQNHRFQRGNIDQLTCQILSLCTLRKAELRNRCGSTSVFCGELTANSGSQRIQRVFAKSPA